MNILFQLDASAPPTPTEMDYLPYGTRSVRVVVQTARPFPPLRLRPRHILPTDTANGIFRGFADGETALQLSWGGGHETGPCVQTVDKWGAFETCAPVVAGHRQTIIFNLTHLGPALPPMAVLTLEAFEDTTGRVVAQLPITLRRPAQLPSSIAQLPHISPTQWQYQAGTHLPVYESRWWPDAAVRYTAAPAHLPLRAELDQKTAVLNFFWNQSLIASIDDRTRPSILAPETALCELFSFSEAYIALRVWFFWLDVNMGHGFFIGRHEVPDAERFDFLIRLSDGKVGLACTDLHWRESWGISANTPQRATIGLSREAKATLVRTGLTKLWDKLWGKNEPTPQAYNPLGYIQRRAKLEARNTRFVVRAHGTEAHVPILTDLLADTESFFSSDVRL